MGKLATAERVSRDASDNFVFQRSLLAYDRAAEIVSGDVLEIGTGTGYGIELVAPHCDRFVTVDKYAAGGDRHAANVEFRRMCVPPLGFGDESFDFVITFQVIEHIDDDAAFVSEIARVLRPGGRLILTTPNAPMCSHATRGTCVNTGSTNCGDCFPKHFPPSRPTASSATSA